MAGQTRSVGLVGMIKNKIFDIVPIAAKHGEVEGEKWRDSMAAHKNDAFMTKKSNPKASCQKKIVKFPFSHVPLLPVFP